MSKAKKKKQAEKLTKAQKRRQLKRSMTMRVMGISIISAAVLLAATKALFEEIFVGDDWSDVDWGEEGEDYSVDID